MTIIRVDVDTQVGFSDPNGKLFVPTAPTVKQHIKALLSDATRRGLPLIGSVDSHAYDAWEFQENGGPFPAHCLKGTADWLKPEGTLPDRFRFIPMSEGGLVVGEDRAGSGNRRYDTDLFVSEALDGVGLYFEKEVYSAFPNPNAEAFIEALVNRLHGPSEVEFQVFGYCTGGFCVDEFCLGLIERGYQVSLIMDATAAIDTPDNKLDGLKHSAETLAAAGVRIINTATALANAA
jgi:nicotinamidase/pyrazinamidase